LGGGGGYWGKRSAGKTSFCRESPKRACNVPEGGKDVTREKHAKKEKKNNGSPAYMRGTTTKE